MTTKNKDPKFPPAEKPDFLDEIGQSTYFQWLNDNRGVLPYAFLTLIVVIALAFKFTSGKSVAAESSYLLAENYFSQLKHSLEVEQGSDNALADLKKLEETIAPYPELQARYDGQIAQILIGMGKPDQANTFAQRSLERSAKDNMPFYTTFSKTTLNIAKGNYKEALDQSKALKEEMLKDPTQQLNGNLFAYNLLRIAILEEKTGTPDAELEAWKEWKGYANGADTMGISTAITTLSNTLKEGEFSLNQYINIRDTIIRKK